MNRLKKTIGTAGRKQSNDSKQTPSSNGWTAPLSTGNNTGDKPSSHTKASASALPKTKTWLPSRSSNGSFRNKGISSRPDSTKKANKPETASTGTTNHESKGNGNKQKMSQPVRKKNNASNITQKPKNASRNGQQRAPTSQSLMTAYAKAPSDNWKLRQLKFTGSFSYDTLGKQEQIQNKPLPKGIQEFRNNPAMYVALMYQTDVLTWPEDQHTYTLIHREGTTRFQAQGASSTGWMTILVQDYQHLPAFPNNQLPTAHRDKYTDNMVHCGRKIHSKDNPPILPGRGMGVGDTPLLKLIGDIDPSDIHQGQVGDCWLLSAISALAEFDGAVRRLFRKTKNLDQLPLAGPNQYTVTLWDLPTWKEVDIVIDERLAAAPGGKGQLLAARPSEDGELWVCYLEKALAVHCGGWDKITGGQCSHAWSLMTGCREQYTIRKNKKSGKYACFAKFNPNEGKWAPHHNCPKDNNSAMWRVPWPKVGGGGGISLELSESELFMRMFAFDRQNYIVAAGTSGTSDKNQTEGMVDNHAYSVIEAVHDAAGTGIDLFKVRNPWGKGEIEEGEFDDDGPGWDRYPQIRKLLKPVVADDGIFWLTKAEFFKYFDHIYVSASSMTQFLEG